MKKNLMKSALVITLIGGGVASISNSPAHAAELTPENNIATQVAIDNTQTPDGQKVNDLIEQNVTIDDHG
ncbi:hypothetical protein, partial [Brevibacillus reuszeri]